jgi:signal peptidase I
MVETGATKSKFWTRRKIIFLVAGITLLGIIVTVAPMLMFIFVAQPVRVQGPGMSRSLNDGDRIFISKRIGNLQRGDIVIFYYPKDPTKSYIKRIVGLPGELIELRDGKTFINDTPLDEPYVDQALNQALADMKSVRIPDQNYFVMGDNRDHSSDSRFWGTLPKSYIYGKVISRYWPSG